MNAEEWFASEHGDHEGPFCREEMLAAYRAGLEGGAYYEEYVVPGPPMITDMGAFDRRTADLRAAGFTKEADSRDKYAHPRRQQ